VTATLPPEVREVFERFIRSIRFYRTARRELRKRKAQATG
jgi:hypothetical protein